MATLDLSVKMAVRALLEVVQSGAKNVEVAIMEDKKPMRVSRLDKSLPCETWESLYKHLRRYETIVALQYVVRTGYLCKLTT